MFKRNYVLIAILSFLLVIPSVNAKDTKSKHMNDERERATKAANVLTEIMKIPESGIPDELMDRAHAIAVIPNVVKGAFGIGGNYGKGLVSHRGANGKWSAPSFIGIGGGSFGLQLGVESTDLVLVFTNDDGFKGLLKGKVKLGADAGVAGGPVGRKAEIATDVLLKSPIVSYSRSKGLFAGISLEGAAITIDDGANHKVYGKDVTAEQILLRGQIRPNNVVMPFMNALMRVTPATRRITQK